jgi:hypothetical protein
MAPYPYFLLRTEEIHEKPQSKQPDSELILKQNKGDNRNTGTFGNHFAIVFLILNSKMQSFIISNISQRTKFQGYEFTGVPMLYIRAAAMLKGKNTRREYGDGVKK